MPVWGALLGTLGYNYARHRHGKSTLCSTARRFIPGAAMVVGWCFLSGWLLPHYVNGFKVDLDRLTD